MDKIALSKRLAGFAEVFKQETKFARDLKAMSVVLESLPEEKFSSLMAEATADEAPKKEMDKKEEKSEKKEKESEPETEEELEPESEPESEPGTEEESEPEETKEEKESSLQGAYWNEEASRAVLSFLREDVVGEEQNPIEASKKTEIKKANKKAAETVPSAKLSPDQIPNGKGNKPAPTLKTEQVPKQEEVLKSNMLEKSRGSVRKQASEEIVLSSEGVELTPPMEEAVLSKEETDKLSMLFD